MRDVTEDEQGAFINVLRLMYAAVLQPGLTLEDVISIAYIADRVRF